MKMVRGLLLGSAAGIVAVAGAQAADLPVKAKPVEYVKVCSLYGVGYYYIPGTDVCMRVGGYVRAEYSYNYGTSMTTGPFNTVSGYETRTDGHDFLMRSRAYITTETRQQTAYGTLRTFLNVGLSYDSPSGAALSANRAFIQIAGFTIGLATSYFDFYAAAATSYLQLPSGDTGDGGWKVFAYTAQIGNGWSATLSLEEPRRSNVVNSSLSGAYLLAGPTPDQIKIRWPDIVASMRVDQAWGSAQIMGAVHDASGGYYTSTDNAPLTGTEIYGHPSDKIGWAVGGGVKINFPMIAPGDFFQTQVTYSQGAIRYVGFTQNGTFNPFMFDGNKLGFGMQSDAVFCGNTSNCASSLGLSGTAASAVELTTAWGINAAYEHFWTPALRTSLYGSYMKVSYNDTAKAIVCGNAFNTAAGTWRLDSSYTNCNPGYTEWGFGSRTQWNVTKDFYMGVDVYYVKLQPEMSGTILYTAAAGTAKPSSSVVGPYVLDDMDNVGTRVRFHRDIVP